MSFTAPLALLLLLSLLFFVWLGRQSSVGGRWRSRISLALRLAIIILIVLALAGTQIVRGADELAVVFLVDASDSIDEESAAEAESFVRGAIESMGPNDQAAVVVFGANALVERPMSGLAELAPITSVPQTLASDIGEAIRLGLALFPAGSARRLVLLSDGADTVGEAQDAAQLAAAAGVPIDLVPLTSTGIQEEAMLVNVDAPSRVSEGAAFAIEVSAESNVSTPANLRILSGGSVVHDEEVLLNPGLNQFSIRIVAKSQEFARYTVQLAPQKDTFYQNNQLAAYTEITGPPRILLVAADGTLDDNGEPLPDESPQLRLALEATGLAVDKVTPADFPASLVELSGYDGVVLINVNAKNLSNRKMGNLQQFVRDLGGGLTVVGGPRSYGTGGYYRTALEESLPVDMQIKDQERFPSVSMVLVIDRSGSMGMQEGALTKIQLAAEGAVRVVELLNDFDEITIIPVDTAPDNPIGPASVAQREEIIGQIRQIGSGGGGIYVRTGLQAAAEALLGTENQVKHIIILADGSDSEQKEGVPELIEALTAEDVTISMVSIGEGPDVPWLQQMAELGGGRFHLTDRAANLPQIFTQETTSIQRTYLVEERFFPQLGSTGFARNHAIFRAMERGGLTRVPPLYGYVGTSAKDTAQVILETHLGDPLLAAWEYGLGRSVAWTSDATGRWGTEWVRWNGFPNFWSNLVRWSLSPGDDSNVEIGVNLKNDTALLTVDAHAENGTYLNDLKLEANVVAPSGETTPVTLKQVAPGQYEGDFKPAAEGAYLIRVTNTGQEGGVAVGQTSGWVLGYSPEYSQLQDGGPALQTIGNIAGGRELAIQDDGRIEPEVFEHDLPGSDTVRPIWPWFIGLAVLLLPLDIAVRRLAIGRRDLEKAWGATLGRWSRSSPTTPERSEQVSRLFQAKERAGRQPVGEQVEPQGPPVPGPMQGSREVPPVPPAPRPDKRPDGSAEEPPESTQDQTLAARLLERRRGQNDPNQ